MRKLILLLIGVLLSTNFGWSSALTDDYVDIASSFVQEGKYSQAMNYINKALDIERDNILLINMQKDLYKLMGRDDIFLSFDVLSGGDEYLSTAIYYYDQCKYREAKEILNKYIEKMPKSDFAYMLRAKTNLSIDEVPSALRDIKSAQAISNNAEYELVEALILYKSGKYAQCKNILKRLSEDVQIYNVYKYMGLSDFKLGNYKEAVESFDRAILLSDDDKTIMQSYNEAKRLSYGN
ncbi:tetratricopeptide repeat protein [bacterium]|nr:tetratricopeptide repeat protein [bacterium]